MKTVKRNGKVQLIQTLVLNLPQKRKTRTLREVQKEQKKITRMLAI